jgi:hypothetical protein
MRDRDVLTAFLNPRYFLVGWQYSWRRWRDLPWLPWRRFHARDEWPLNVAFALLGLVLGALAAPSLVQVTRGAGTAYQDALVVAVALVSSLCVFLVGYHLAFVMVLLSAWISQRIWGAYVTLVVAAIGYGVYRYVAWVGPGQREVSVAFVGGLLIKVFLIPLIRAWSRARRSHGS